jgi:hypothetical protein
MRMQCNMKRQCRGKERSRPRTSILDEVKRLCDQGIRQVTLLGQNVNSYADFSDSVAAVAPVHVPVDTPSADLTANARAGIPLDGAAEPPASDSHSHPSGVNPVEDLHGPGLGGFVGAEAGLLVGRSRLETGIHLRGAEIPPGKEPFRVYAEGFESVYKVNRNGAVTFSELLHQYALLPLPFGKVLFTFFGTDTGCPTCALYHVAVFLEQPVSASLSCVPLCSGRRQVQ